MNKLWRPVVLAGLLVGIILSGAIRETPAQAPAIEYATIAHGPSVGHVAYVARVPRDVRRSFRYQQRHLPAVVVRPAAPVAIPTTPAVGLIEGQIVGWRSPTGYFYRAGYQSTVMAPFLPAPSLQSGPSPEAIPSSSAVPTDGAPEVIPTPPAETVW